MGSLAMITKVVLLTIAVAAVVGPSRVEAAGSLTEQCSGAIQQVTSCLTFATGKAAEPTKECCNTVGTMKDKQPVCLCFFIGQAHNGSQEIKSLGIQEAKLLQLPSACQLTHASVSDCPKLLGISPTSPAAAIFMNSNTTSPATSTSSSSSSPSSTNTPAADDSSGFKRGISGLLSCLIALIVSSFL